MKFYIESPKGNWIPHEIPDVLVEGVRTIPEAGPWTPLYDGLAEQVGYAMIRAIKAPVRDEDLPF